MFRKILVAYDGSPNARCALRHALRLAQHDGSAVWSLSVEEPLPRYASAAEEVRAEEADARAYFDRLQEEAQREAAGHGLRAETEAVRGHAAQAIVEYARQVGADLIVLGQRGHNSVLDRVLGSTSDRVVDTASCSVLVVPGEAGLT